MLHRRRQLVLCSLHFRHWVCHGVWLLQVAALVVVTTGSVVLVVG